MKSPIWEWCKRFWRDESGVVMLETALVFPIQLLLTLFIMQAALIWSAANVVNYAAFQAARTAMVHIKGGVVTNDVQWRAMQAAHAITSALSNPAKASPRTTNTVTLRTLHHDYYLKRNPLLQLEVSVFYDGRSGLSAGFADDSVVTAAVRLYFPLTVPLAGGIMGLGVSGNKLSNGVRYIPMYQAASLPKPWPN